MILFGPASLERAILELMAHYHAERNHQGLDNELIQPEQQAGCSEGEVHCRDRLGGMLRYYHRAA